MECTFVRIVWRESQFNIICSSNLPVSNFDAMDFTVFGTLVCYTQWFTRNKILFDGIKLIMITFLNEVQSSLLEFS